VADVGARMLGDGALDRGDATVAPPDNFAVRTSLSDFHSNEAE
jgi:hypothetical protein